MDVKVINKTADYMKEHLSKDSPGHDWWHTYRVWRMGKNIATATIIKDHFSQFFILQFH